MKKDSLGHFEQLVLTAILNLKDGAYGAAIHTKVSDLEGVRSVNLGSVYVTLDRLQDKGYVTSWFADSSPERGGKARRYFKLEAAGEQVLKDTIEQQKRLAEAAEGAW
jgi:PadR family transcriptional regulator PadR